MQHRTAAGSDADISGPGTTWSEARVREFLEHEDPCYHRIELPYGLATRGTDRRPFCDRILGADLTGKTVLDVGSKFGFFSFEALKRGAARVLGVDMDPRSVRKARTIADILGSKAEFRLLDIDREPIEEEFDVVLCLNILHHLHNPIAALDTLVRAAREKLVIETATLGKHDRRKLGLSLPQSMLLNNASVLFVGGGKRGKRLSSGQRYFFSRKALETVLSEHHRVFAQVESFPSDFKDRFVTVARKRRIERLIVVGGPTSAGKSTFIERLQGGELPDVAKELRMQSPESWVLSAPVLLDDQTEERVPAMLFHYDFLRPMRSSAKTYERDPFLEVIRSAAEVRFVTIWEPAEVLARQIESGEIQPNMKGGEYTGHPRHLALREQYGDPIKVKELYQPWIDFCEGQARDHCVLSFSQGTRILSVADWSRLADGDRAPDARDRRR